MLARTLAWVLAFCVASRGVMAAEMPPKPAASKVLLKQRYLPGSYVMTNTIDLASESLEEGQAQPAASTSSMLVVISMEISPPDADGARTALIRYRRIVQRESVGGETQAVFDSDRPPNLAQDPLAAALAPLMKARINVWIGPDDRVTGVGGLNELWDGIAKENPDRAPAMARLKATTGDDFIKNLLNEVGKLLPADPVGPGDQWQPTLKMNVPSAGEVEYKPECRLLDVEQTAAGKMAIVAFDATCKTTQAMAARIGAQERVVHRMTSSQVGLIRFNVEGGFAERQVVHQDAVMEMSETGPGAKRVTLKQKMRMEVVWGRESAPAASPLVSPGTR